MFKRGLTAHFFTNNHIIFDLFAYALLLNGNNDINGNNQPERPGLVSN